LEKGKVQAKHNDWFQEELDVDSVSFSAYSKKRINREKIFDKELGW
jgi:hypothetical protein